MVPPMRAESYGQLSRLLLERCDGLARDSYCPRLLDVPVAEVFDEERAALMPLPSTAFDPVRWESRTADKYGLVDIDSNRYLAGPDSARSRVLAAIRWDTVTLTSPATGECVCSIESGPCERVDVFHVSGRFWSTSACGEKRTPARPAWTSFPS